jgi:hypothetical protein
MARRTYKTKRSKPIGLYDRLVHVYRIAREPLYIISAIASILGLLVGILSWKGNPPGATQCREQVIQVIHVEISQEIRVEHDD